MKVVYLNINSDVLPIEEGIVLALGYFDGLHLAHQHLVKETVSIAKAKQIKNGLMTFNPNPKHFLGKQEIESLLTPQHMKIDLLNKMGVDYLFVISFDESVSELTHQAFIERFVLPLNVQHVVTGFDYHYGYKGQGNVNTLVEDGHNQFGLSIIEEVTLKGEKISSSKVRDLLLAGEVYEAKDLLGRFYITEGIVIHGFKRGRELGYPTANISTIDHYLIPDNGVYIVKVELFKQEYYGMCNVGYNPTFSENNNKSVEVHIFDFNKDIYNEKLSITWIKKIRDERKFNGRNDLVSQLNKDKKDVLDFVNNQL